MRLEAFRRFLADPDVAIDLGTANTRLYVVDRGLVADEPTLVRVKNESKDAGRSKHAALNGSDDFVAPLKGGVVWDIAATAFLLNRILKRARRFGLIRSRALVCAPSGVSLSHRGNLVEAVRRSGITQITLVPETLASAIGAGLDISSPHAQLIVDIGDGLTDLAVIRSRRIVCARATRKACGDLRSAVQRTVARRKDLFLYRREAERLVQESGATPVAKVDKRLPATGIHRKGYEASVELSGHEISEAVNPVIKKIVKTIRETVRSLSPEVAVEVIESGIWLTGGGACLPGIDGLIASETSIDVKVAADPLHATINGASHILATSSVAGLWDSGEIYRFER